MTTEDLFSAVAALVDGPAAFMEVCGTHTMAIGRHGLRARLPKDLRLISGPGCPVCVTSAGVLDQAMAMAHEPGVRVATFGDLIRVPGSRSSLGAERGLGARVSVVYSPIDALEHAAKHPAELVVFIGVGFETTSPTIAATVLRAKAAGIENFLVLPAFKLVPPAMEALASAAETRLDGFIAPGHATVLLGCAPYEPIAQKYHLPCVVTGFDAPDILEGVRMLLAQKRAGEARVEIQYRRAVSWDGNPKAMALLFEVFEPCDAIWRGIGGIPASGLQFRPEFRSFDARLRVPVAIEETADLPPGCSCGAVMKGLKTPPECPLFGRSCLPSHAVGPCMVSSEGACAAWYKYGDRE